jgi:hypothetical protein
MAEEYGYLSRPPMPDRFVAGGIAEPRNQWPRKIKSGVSSGDSTVARNFLALLNSSNADVVGPGLTMTESNNNGTIVATANGWDATWKRTGRLIDLTGTSAGGMGSSRSYSRWEVSPAAMCQLNVTGTAGYYAPYVFTISAVVAARSTTMPAGGSAGVAFGLTNYTLTPTVIPTSAFVGFAAAWAAPAVSANWSTWIDNTGGTLARATNLTMSTNAPHLLEIEFNAPDRAIYWYVDGELADSYSPADGDVLTHATYGCNIEYVANASNTAVTRMLTLADTIPLVSVSILDLDEGT